MGLNMLKFVSCTLTVVGHQGVHFQQSLVRAVTFLEKGDKRCYNSITWEEDCKWLYYSQSKWG